jgi:hypothetical protein
MPGVILVSLWVPIHRTIMAKAVNIASWTRLVMRAPSVLLRKMNRDVHGPYHSFVLHILRSLRTPQHPPKYQCCTIMVSQSASPTRMWVRDDDHINDHRIAAMTAVWMANTSAPAIGRLLCVYLNASRSIALVKRSVFFTRELNSIYTLLLRKILGKW